MQHSGNAGAGAAAHAENPFIDTQLAAVMLPWCHPSIAIALVIDHDVPLAGDIERAFAETLFVDGCADEAETRVLEDVFGRATGPRVTVYRRSTTVTHLRRLAIPADAGLCANAHSAYAIVPIDRRRVTPREIGFHMLQPEDERVVTASAFYSALHDSAFSINAIDAAGIPRVTLAVIRGKVPHHDVASSQTLAALALERFTQADDRTFGHCCFFARPRPLCLAAQPLRRGTTSSVKAANASPWIDVLGDAAFFERQNGRVGKTTGASFEKEMAVARRLFPASATAEDAFARLASFRAHFAMRYLVVAAHLGCYLVPCVRPTWYKRLSFSQPHAEVGAIAATAVRDTVWFTEHDHWGVPADAITAVPPVAAAEAAGAAAADAGAPATPPADDDSDLLLDGGDFDTAAALLTELGSEDACRVDDGE
jgi:hypothetical protein